jgi:hypothetical protein
MLSASVDRLRETHIHRQTLLVTWEDQELPGILRARRERETEAELDEISRDVPFETNV